MKKFLIISTIASATAFAVFTSAFAAPPTCEDLIKKMEVTMKTTKLKDADMKAVLALKSKATERCVAEDDRRAEGFISDEMKIITKK